MKKQVIGIDPGKHGCIAVLDMESHGIVGIHKMPQTPADAITLFQTLSADADIAYLEQVAEMPGQRGMFEFGRNYGMIETALSAVGISHYKIKPQLWQKAFHLAKPSTADKAKAYRERKNILKAKAQEIFPQVKVTLETADGLLIAEYAYQHERKN